MFGMAMEWLRLLNNRKLPPDELTKLQNKKLRRLIRYAYDNVPYYRSLFDSTRLKPGDIRGIEDLKHIPVTTKDDLRAAGEQDTIAKGIRLSSCVSTITSGSTGEPLTVHLTRHDLKRYRMVAFRSLLSIGFGPRDRVAILGLTRPQKKQFYQRLGIYASTSINPRLSTEDQIEILRKFNPTILWFYPTVIRSLLHNIDHPLRYVVRPRALIYGAEVLDDVLKKQLRDELSVEMFNFYGSIEAGRIAAECPTHDGLHVNVDHVILECVDGNEPVDDGELGITCITILNNFTMPLIRYRLGDICRYIIKQCDCGCHFPLIAPPHGRKEDILHLPDGKALSPRVIGAVLREVDGIKQFRLVQERLDRFVLQVVFADYPRSEILQTVQSSMMKCLGESVKLDVEVVDFMKEDGPKFRAFVSNLPKSQELEF